jgi:hypothetical protein
MQVFHQRLIVLRNDSMSFSSLGTGQSMIVAIFFGFTAIWPWVWNILKYLTVNFSNLQFTGLQDRFASHMICKTSGVQCIQLFEGVSDNKDIVYVNEDTTLSY